MGTKPDEQLSLLFTWQGTDPSLKPVVLCAHLDVVPCPTPEAWDHPPFGGHIDRAAGVVWGQRQRSNRLLYATPQARANALIDYYVPRHRPVPKD